MPLPCVVLCCVQAGMSAASSAASAKSPLDHLREHNSASVADPIHNRAAVLVGIFSYDGLVWVLLTVRNSKLRSHAGEVALPGGHRDLSDCNDIMTALREAEEEIGLCATDEHIRVLTTLPSIYSKNMLSVRPVVARIPVPTFMHKPAATATAAADVIPAPNDMTRVVPNTSPVRRVGASGGGSMPINSAAAIARYPIRAIAAAALKYENPKSGAAQYAASQSDSGDEQRGWLPYFVPTPSPDEVDTIFAVPLALFLTTERYSYQDIHWLGSEFRIHRFHYVTDRYWSSEHTARSRDDARETTGSLVRLPDDRPPVPTPPREFLIWGMTAYVLTATAALLYGTPPEFVFSLRSGSNDIHEPKTTNTTATVTAAAATTAAAAATKPAAAAGTDRLSQLAITAEQRIRSGPLMAATNEQLRALLRSPQHSTASGTGASGGDANVFRPKQLSDIKSKL